MLWLLILRDDENEKKINARPITAGTTVGKASSARQERNFLSG